MFTQSIILTFCLGFGLEASAAVIIDDFSGGEGPAGGFIAMSGPGILGGARFVNLDSQRIVADVSDGVMTIQALRLGVQGQIAYHGADPFGTPFGLGSVDLLAWGDRFIFEISPLMDAVGFSLVLYEDGANGVFTDVVFSGSTGVFEIPFSEFDKLIGAGADLTSVEAISVDFFYLPSGETLQIDSISVGIPEPGTSVLFVTGVALLSRFGRRRRLAAIH